MKIIAHLIILLTISLGVASADEITDWTQITIEATLTAPVTPAPVATRVTAMVLAAVFDSVNGIERRYTAIHVPPAAPPGASARAAIVQSAYAMLSNLYPEQKSMLDQRRAASLAAIPDTDGAVDAGLSWGQNVAGQIWTWRSQDGFSNAPAPYVGATDPGQWRPTPPANAAGLAPQMGTMTPWVIRSPSQFRPQGPVAMTSDQYAADFNEVKTMGSATSSARTADQTLLARFWQAGNPADYWDQVIASLAARRHLPMPETARLLALVNVAMADAIIGCWDAKYKYSSWRPLTAIQLGDTDSNDATAADGTWTPLVANPPFPEYPSAHSCASGAAGYILSQVFGEQTTFNVVSIAMPGVTRTFHSFTAALDEVKSARILGGIHFRTATVDGSALGTAVGKYVMTHAMLSTRGGRRD